MYKVKPLALFSRIEHTTEWSETGIIVPAAHVPLHIIFPRKIILTHRTRPIHVNSVEAQRELRKNENDLSLYRILKRLYYSSSVLFLLLFLLLLLLLLNNIVSPPHSYCSSPIIIFFHHNESTDNIKPVTSARKLILQSCLE